METRVALISIIVEEGSATDEVNAILHEYNSIIIGRMGIPYRKKDIGIISIAVDGTQDTINTLKQAGYKDITTKLYANMRHEVLNEKDHMVVYEDVLNWLEEKIH